MLYVLMDRCDPIGIQFRIGNDLAHSVGFRDLLCKLPGERIAATIGDLLQVIVDREIKMSIAQ